MRIPHDPYYITDCAEQSNIVRNTRQNDFDSKSCETHSPALLSIFTDCAEQSKVQNNPQGRKGVKGLNGPPHFR